MGRALQHFSRRIKELALAVAFRTLIAGCMIAVPLAAIGIFMEIQMLLVAFVFVIAFFVGGAFIGALAGIGLASWELLTGRLPGEFQVAVHKDGTATITRTDGTVMVVDAEYREYLQSNRPQPSKIELNEAMDKSTMVRIWDGGVCRGEPMSTRVICEIDDASEINLLKAALEIIDGPGGHCMCHGNPGLELLSATGERLALLGVHHGESIRWDHWKDDARLINGRSLLTWLARQGIAEPLAQANAIEQTREAEERARQRWTEAIPLPLQLAPEEVWQTPDPEAMHQILTKEMPGIEARVLALLHWYGSGEGPWPGPSHEVIPELLLLYIPTDRVVHVLQSSQPASTHLDGAMRYFSSRGFALHRRQDLARIPLHLKTQLIEHCRRDGDSTKLTILTQAFGTEPVS